MATVCVKLIENASELYQHSGKKIAIKAADSNVFTVHTVGEEDPKSFVFVADRMYAQVVADDDADADDTVDGSNADTVDGSNADTVDGSNADTVDGSVDGDAERKKLEEEERKRLEEAEQNKYMSNEPPGFNDSDGASVMSEMSNKSTDTTVHDGTPGGGKRRKSTKRGRKSTRKGRKSSGKGRKSVKRGRKGKGSRRSKK
jgi:hypothetical protein